MLSWHSRLLPSLHGLVLLLPSLLGGLCSTAALLAGSCLRCGPLLQLLALALQLLRLLLGLLLLRLLPPSLLLGLLLLLQLLLLSLLLGLLFVLPRLLLGLLLLGLLTALARLPWFRRSLSLLLLPLRCLLQLAARPTACCSTGRISAILLASGLSLPPSLLGADCWSRGCRGCSLLGCSGSNPVAAGWRLRRRRCCQPLAAQQPQLP